MYVGSISDVELTRVSGFLDCLKDKPGMSIMADRGFTIKHMLQEMRVELNIPPFLKGKTAVASKRDLRGEMHCILANTRGTSYSED